MRLFFLLVAKMFYIFLENTYVLMLFSRSNDAEHIWYLLPEVQVTPSRLHHRIFLVEFVIFYRFWTSWNCMDLNDICHNWRSCKVYQIYIVSCRTKACRGHAVLHSNILRVQRHVCLLPLGNYGKIHKTTSWNDRGTYISKLTATKFSWKREAIPAENLLPSKLVEKVKSIKLEKTCRFRWHRTSDETIFQAKDDQKIWSGLCAVQQFLTYVGQYIHISALTRSLLGSLDTFLTHRSRLVVHTPRC